MKQIAILPLFALTLTGIAIHAQNGTLYTLRMKFVAGTVSRYQTNAQVITSIPLGAGSEPIKNTLDVDLLQSLYVNKVTAKGAGEIATTTQSGRIVMNGKNDCPPGCQRDRHLDVRSAGKPPQSDRAENRQFRR